MQASTRDRVRRLMLDRPQPRNAIASQTVQDLEHELDAAKRDAAIGAILLGGSPLAFCAGSDLKELGALSTQSMCEHELETARVARLDRVATEHFAVNCREASAQAALEKFKVKK